MNIKINGDLANTEHNVLSEIIDQYGAKPPYALAVNGDFVPKSQYHSFEVKDGDLIDVVSPIFGG